MRLDCSYCRRASVDLARATGDPQAVMSCTQHPEDDAPTADPRIDPRLIEAAAAEFASAGESLLGDISYGIATDMLTAALRAAREEGANIHGDVYIRASDGTLWLFGEDNVKGIMRPLDGGDDE